MAEANVFELQFPFEYKGSRYERLTPRPPKVRDLRNFLRNLDKGDSINAMEKVIGDLCETDEKIIAEMDIRDFMPIKAWFEAFLQDGESA